MKNPNVIGPEDYSNFSMEAIEKSLRDLYDEIKTKTGATDEQMAAAWAESTAKIMDINCLREPNR
jgi:hypothetical protein